MLNKKTFKKGLSVVINTKNEEDHIRGCLNSVLDWANEIIVVDMSSTDKTTAIARKYGAKIYTVKDCGWVEPVRNWSCDQANYEWILVLDADERIPKTLRNKIDESIRADKCDAVKIPWKNIFFGSWIRHTLWWPDYHIRLFKKGYAKWETKIHPKVLYKGRLLELEPLEKLAVVHYNAENINVWMRKIDAYTSRETYYGKQKHLTPQQVIERLDSEFVVRYFHSQGYLDGIHGFILSKFMEFYRFLEFAKYWENQGYPQLFKKDELKKVCEIRYDNSVKTRLLSEEVNNLRYSLNQITSSKTYKIWQLYCRLRDGVLNKIIRSPKAFNHPHK